MGIVGVKYFYKKLAACYMKTGVKVVDCKMQVVARVQTASRWEKRMKRRSSEAGMRVEPLERHVFLTPPCHCGRVQTAWVWRREGDGKHRADRVGKNQQSGYYLQLQHTRKTQSDPPGRKILDIYHMDKHCVWEYIYKISKYLNIFMRKCLCLHILAF